MVREIFAKKNLLIIIELALFNFVFLGIEYFFDAMIGFTTDSSGVVMAQNEVLGASVIGFVLYAFLEKMLGESKAKRNLLISLVVVCSFLLFIIYMYKSYLLILLAGILVFIILGIAGSAICYEASTKISNREYLARIVGIAYAFGVLIQFVNNNIVKNQLIQLCVIITLLVVFAYIFWQVYKTEAQEQDIKSIPLKNPRVSLVALIICVALMTVIFSTLDASVTLVHASGDFNIGQWPRLILAVSGLLAGFAFDLHNRKVMPQIMYLVTILATICIVIIQFGGSFIIGLLIFYMSAGFFVVFFMTSFMDMSLYMKEPRLWAGIGRATNNFCAFITSALSVTLIANGSQMTIMIVALILFVLINIALMFYMTPLRTAEISELKETAVVEAKENMITMSDEEKFDKFVSTYNLTEREKDVLRALIESDDNVSKIATQLGLSRSVLYRHFSNINKKTETNSRLGIIQFYHGWKSETEK